MSSHSLIRSGVGATWDAALAVCRERVGVRPVGGTAVRLRTRAAGRYPARRAAAGRFLRWDRLDIGPRFHEAATRTGRGVAGGPPTRMGPGDPLGVRSSGLGSQPAAV